MNTPSLLRRFVRDSRGSTALMFGMAAIPLTVLAGGGLDLAQINRAEQSLQHAVDAAALYGARTSLENEGEADTAARNYLETRADLATADIDTSLDNGVLTVSATRDVPTAFLGLVGIKTMRILAESGATTGGGGMELALVLDVSGSMKGWKVESLKASALNLMSTIYGEETTLPGVWVAVVPFSGRVNIIDYGPTWMKTTTGAKPAPKPKGGGTTTPKLCTGFRTSPNYETDAPPSVELFPAYTGDSKWCPGPKMIGLTATRATIDAGLSALYAGDGTSTQIGMVWGWRALSPSWQGLWGNPDLPLAHDRSPAKVVVIMTDGENHPDQPGDPFTKEEVNAQLLRECAAMKAEGYTIFAVTFMMNGTLTSLYQQCATTPEHVYDANSSAELMAAFEDIGGNLNEGLLRLVY